MSVPHPAFPKLKILEVDKVKHPDERRLKKIIKGRLCTILGQ
jgi:hypothetical protein